MSEIFKLKVNIGNACVELEGEASFVHKILTELREEGLGKLSSQECLASDVNENQKLATNFNHSNSENEDVDKTMPIIGQRQSKPNIKDIVIKNLPKTEVEWILIYALYVSNDGEKTFTAEDLRQMYRDTNRMTETRNKNFSTNIRKAVTADWFVAINDNDYALSENGKTSAFQILERTSSGIGKSKTKKSNQSHAKAAYQMLELGLEQNEREDVKKYFNSFEKINNMEKALVISYWLKKNKNIEEVNEHYIFTILRIVGQNTSFDIKAALRNGKNQCNYFIAGEKAGFYKTHHIGEDHIVELENERGDE